MRGFGDGFAIILLPAYLSAIGFSSGQIGIILSAWLLGTALLTLAVGFIARGTIFVITCLVASAPVSFGPWSN